MERYQRQILLDEIGTEGQRKLLKSSVLVIGAGGLGCPVLTYLAGAGVGRIGVADHDRIELHNLHRQVLFDTSQTGQNKAEAAVSNLRKLNPEITLEAYPFRLDASNALMLFPSYDLIVDATDHIATRYLINDAAILCDKPWVYSGLFKFEAQLAVFNLRGSATYRCLFPIPPSDKNISGCNETGVLGVTPGVLGILQANEALKVILGIGTPLVNQVYCLNLLSMESYRIAIKPGSYDREQLRQALEEKAGALAAHGSLSLSLESALALENASWIDVREQGELPAVPGAISLPLGKVLIRETPLEMEGRKIFFCQSGYRAGKAALHFRQMGDQHAFALSCGAEELSHQLKIANNGKTNV